VDFVLDNTYRMITGVTLSGIAGRRKIRFVDLRPFLNYSQRSLGAKTALSNITTSTVTEKSTEM
jgi:hypothetical protein